AAEVRIRPEGPGGTMRVRREQAIQIKTEAQLAAMAEAGRVVASALRAAAAAAAPGDSTAELDAIAAHEIQAAGATPSFLDYRGHGIGKAMHMDPAVPNQGRPGRDPLLAEGMALAIEPLLVLGSPDTRQLDDDWTVVSEDGSPAAHFEHTMAVTADGPWVLTAPDGGREGFARLAK